jgi:hypothetical protein
MESADFPLTFIVRVSMGKRALRGVVERVRSGEKQRFDGAAALAEVIAAMVERETTMKRQKEPTR